MKKKILVIDDEELLTRTFSRLLEIKNYDVLVASRPEDAIVFAEEEDFDLILSDIRMPGKSGVDTVLEIYRTREKLGKSRPPVIFLTGFADPKVEREAQALEPAAYVFKPFDMTKLLDLIHQTVQNA